MLNWLANALATRIQRADNAKVVDALKEIREEREAGRREVRALVGEMEDMLEKFSRVVARQAMRRSRAMKQALEEDSEQQPQPETTAAALPNDIRARKQELRRRFGVQIPGRTRAADA